MTKHIAMMLETFVPTSDTLCSEFPVSPFPYFLLYNKHVSVSQSISAQHCTFWISFTFPCCVVFPCMTVPLFIYSFCCWCKVCCFLVCYFQTFLNLFPGAHFQVYLGYIIRSGSVRSKYMCLALVSDARLVFKEVTPIYTPFLISEFGPTW